MADSGLGFDPPPGHHPQVPHLHLPYSMYPVQQLPSGGSAHPIVHNEEAAQDSYHQSRNVIPGLGLPFQNPKTQWVTPWPGVGAGPGNAQMNSSQQDFHDPSPREYDGRPSAVNGTETKAMQIDISEEGEISEGEVEDIYEPRGDEEQIGMSEDIRNTHHTIDVSDDGEMIDGPSASHSTGRDRSGSYSPYLSPREIEQNLLSSNPTYDDTLNPGVSSKQAMVGQNGSLPLNHLHTGLPRPQFPKTMSEGRREALDAIRRLWPLKVRYQDYVDEGIDEPLLESLFKELGFEVGKPAKAAFKPSSKSDTIGATTVEKTAHGVSADKRQESPKIKTTETPAKDNAESRKDRIARLLAAKNSKPSTSAPPSISASAQAPTITSTDPPTTSMTSRPSSVLKSQSEKSKILYQKMEALRKARELEARGQKRPHPEESISKPRSANDLEAAISIDVTGSGKDQTMRSHSQTGVSSSSPNSQSAPPIPGLFLSSTPQPSQSSQSLQGGPESKTNSDSVVGHFKRPFGQARESRPFLIDVSDDDDDDADMEIDSPEQNSRALPIAASPALRATSIRSHYSSPHPMPPGIANDGSAKGDLESMNKKIEAMRRKIAEAEARKRAKISRPGSPTFPVIDNLSTSVGSETPVSSKESIVQPSLSSVEPQASSSITQSISNTPPRRIPRTSNMRIQSSKDGRSRSRTASERLPILEARRRERQLKLQLLQAQVASIELEIRENLQEEERLREDADASDSTQAETRPTELPEPALASRNSTPPTEAMDTTTPSTQSSEIAENSRDISPEQKEESLYHNHEGSPSRRTAPTNYTGTNLETKLVDYSRISTDVDIIIPSATEGGKPEATHSPQDTPIKEPSEPTGTDSDDSSNRYEPPDVDPSNSPPQSPESNTFDPTSVQQGLVAERDESNSQRDASLSPEQPTSTAQHTTTSKTIREVDTARNEAIQLQCLTKKKQVESVSKEPTSETSQSTFVKYETPLRYFTSYRFHPEFNQSVAGGLRSLTYSNKIDVKKEVCPDELAGHTCPRGTECEYQHFENMQAPDDQILLQLGACNYNEDTKKQEYINGLRQLLTDFRNRKVKDFQTISQGIIDYRAQFLGDRSKILPLGNVSI